MSQFNFNKNPMIDPPNVSCPELSALCFKMGAAFCLKSQIPGLAET